MSIITKKVFMKEKNGILEYLENLLNSNLNDLEKGLVAKFRDTNGEVHELYVNGETIYNNETMEYENDHYFEVESIHGTSDCIYRKIESEETLLEILLINN